MPEASRNISIILGGIVAVLLIWMVSAYVNNSPQENSSASKLERAVDELADGVENAAEEMRDRTPAEKLGDAIEDTGDAIQDAAK